jgi:hypothetical protein
MNGIKRVSVRVAAAMAESDRIMRSFRGYRSAHTPEKNEIKNCGTNEQIVSADTQAPDEVLSVTYQTTANCTSDEPKSVMP